MQFFFLIILAHSQDLFITLTQANTQLAQSNTILQQKLKPFISTENSAILDDFYYSKEKIYAITAQYWEHSDTQTRISLAQDLQKHTQSLLEDIQLLGGQVQEISAQIVRVVLQSLNDHILAAQQSKHSQALALAYNELKLDLDLKSAQLTALEIENAQLIGQLESARAELDSTAVKYFKTREGVVNVNQELALIRKRQEAQLELITRNLEGEEIISRAKQIKEFKDNQDAQDGLILQLQNLSAELSLDIEQFSVENVKLNSRMWLMNTTLDRLQKELQAKSLQLQAANTKFEQFRVQIQHDSNGEVSSLKMQETLLKQEVFSLLDTQNQLVKELEMSQAELEHLTVVDNQNNNEIIELNLELQENQQRITQAKTARNQELQNLKEKVLRSDQQAQAIKSQLNDSIRKQSQQLREIQKIRNEIEALDYYTSQKIEALETTLFT